MANLVDLVVESQRLRLLCGLEDVLWSAGYEHVAGVDEVGRGCLAGPVVVAAVIPRRGVLVPGVDDSKALSEPERERLASEIRRHSVAFAIASEPADAVDRTNILRSTERAMVRAIEYLKPVPALALVDAVPLRACSVKSVSPVKGDVLSYAIACASILAKVERDQMMRALDKEYPQYDFASNKGYGAPAHLAALEQFGPTPIHRLTFRSVLPRTGEAETARTKTGRTKKAAARNRQIELKMCEPKVGII